MSPHASLLAAFDAALAEIKKIDGVPTDVYPLYVEAQEMVESITADYLHESVWDEQKDSGCRSCKYCRYLKKQITAIGYCAPHCAVQHEADCPVVVKMMGRDTP